jgi:hypothetical protein
LDKIISFAKPSAPNWVDERDWNAVHRQQLVIPAESIKFMVDVGEVRVGTRIDRVKSVAQLGTTMEFSPTGAKLLVSREY